MHPLLHSPFLQALGYAIINSLWQFALLWLLYFSVNTVFKLSSHQKYATGLVLEFAGFTWFLGTLLFYYNQSILLAQHVVTGHQVYLPAFANSGAGFKDRFFLLVLRSEQFFPYLSIAYLALLFILALRWIYAYRYTKYVRTEGLSEIQAEWQLFVQKLSLQLGINRRVQIFLSELVQTPLTVGFFKPLILIPIATINYLNPQQMEAVILHELAHIRRFDYLFNLLLALIEACMFFNPFMQLIQQQVKKERENCCDDWVLKYEYSAASYARALLQIASYQTHSPLLALKATENKQLLISRVKRIIEKKERTFFNYKYQLLALFVMTLVFSLLSFLSPQKKIKTALTSVKRSDIIFEPMAAKVSNPLFNPVFFLANSSKIVVEQRKKTAEIKSLKPPNAFNRVPESPAAVIEDENDQIIEPPFDMPLEAPRVAIAGDVNSSSENVRREVEKNNVEIYAENKSLRETGKQANMRERYFQRFQNADAVKENAALSLEKASIQLRNALDQIKLSKKQVDLNKLQGVVRIGIRKMQKENARRTDINVFKLNELELLEKQIENQMDSLNQPKFFTTRLNVDFNYNFQLPPVVFALLSGEKEHSFSYEYSPKPRLRVMAPPPYGDCSDKVKKRREKVMVTNDGGETKPGETISPLPAPATKLRAVYIIKI